jgi:hypothetical protein
MRDLITGVEELIRPTLGGVPVVAVKMPASPDRVVVVNALSHGDHTTMPLGDVMIQVRSRGAQNDPLDAYDLDAATFDVLQGLTGATFGEVVVLTLARRIHTPLGVDSQNRTEVVSQYYGTASVAPTSNRPDGGSW